MHNAEADTDEVAKMRSRSIQRHFSHSGPVIVIPVLIEEGKEPAPRGTGYLTLERTEMTLRRYAVVIESTSTEFSAHMRDVLDCAAGCAAAGGTEGETRQNHWMRILKRCVKWARRFRNHTSARIRLKMLYPCLPD